MEDLKAAVQPLADKDKKESPFSKEKGEFLCLRDGLWLKQLPIRS